MIFCRREKSVNNYSLYVPYMYKIIFTCFFFNIFIIIISISDYLIMQMVNWCYKLYNYLMMAWRDICIITTAIMFIIIFYVSII